MRVEAAINAAQASRWPLPTSDDTHGGEKLPALLRVMVVRYLSPPPPLAQARPRSQRCRQNRGSTPTLCLDKPVLVRNTQDSKAWCVAAVPGIAMLAMAKDHIKTNSIGLQCVVPCCYDPKA